jgi:hypothetical protein
MPDRLLTPAQQEWLHYQYHRMEACIDAAQPRPTNEAMIKAAVCPLEPELCEEVVVEIEDEKK